MKIRIECTREHLEKSKFCATIKRKGSVESNCWIAVAVADVFPGATVGSEIIEIYGNMETGFISIQLPEIAREQIIAFDSLSMRDFFKAEETARERLEKLKPFSFEVTLTDDQIKVINEVYGYSIKELEEIIEKTENFNLIEA